jgi:hypothetical protein
MPSQLNDELLASKRLKGDDVADEFVTRYLSSSDSKSVFYNWLSQVNSNRDFENFPDIFKGEKIVAEAQTLPPWADKRLMLRGSEFFVKHAEQVMQLLGLLSLPYCYAAADGAMVLYLSQRLKDDAHKRLLDTADFIWDVMAPNAFEEEGNGFSAILKIRLTHAIARFYTLNSGKWDSNLGFPVNQEDMAGTNLAFSLIVIRGMRYMLGIDADLITPDGKSANLLEHAIRKRHFKTSEQGRALTKSLLNYFNQVTPANVSQQETIQLMRYLLGDEVAEILGIPDLKLPALAPAVLSLVSKFPKLHSTENIKILYQQKRNEFKKQRTL